jgi:ferritin
MCGVKGFQGAAAFLYRRSEEDRMHMLKMFIMSTTRGGHALLDKLENPVATYASLLNSYSCVRTCNAMFFEINKLYGLNWKRKIIPPASSCNGNEEQIEEKVL